MYLLFYFIKSMTKKEWQLTSCHSENLNLRNISSPRRCPSVSYK